MWQIEIFYKQKLDGEEREKKSAITYMFNQFIHEHTRTVIEYISIL